MKILIIENEAIIALQLKNLLSQEGYVVCGISSLGEEALELAIRERPDAILLDINLCGLMDGITAAIEIRSILDTAVIIFMTGYNDPEIKERALALNPAGYLIKPIKLEELKSILEEFCRSSD